MPEINPYEPPQSELKRTSSEKSPAAAGTMTGRFLVPSLIGLQIAAGCLAYMFYVMQALAHSGYQRLQVIAQVFLISCMMLGLLLIMLAAIRGWLKLFIFEVLFLLILFWLSLPDIQ